MTGEANNQLPGCLGKRMLVVLGGAGLFALLVLTYCAWVVGVPATIAVRSVPVFPGADMRTDARQFFDIGEDGINAYMMYHVDRPWPEVADFYRQEMGRLGWEITKEDTENRALVTEVCIKFQRFKIFVASVSILGYKMDQGQPESTTVTVHTREQLLCR